jgi:hypothetical protein
VRLANVSRSNFWRTACPNDAGYAYMASEVVRAITSSAYPAPQSNCAAMTLVQ